MSRLLMRSSWGECAPPPGTPLDPSHPLNQGVIYAFPLNEGGGSLIHNYAPAIGSTYSLRQPGIYTSPDWTGPSPWGGGSVKISSTQSVKLADAATNQKAWPYTASGTVSLWYRNVGANWISNSNIFYATNAINDQQFGVLNYLDGKMYCGFYKGGTDRQPSFTSSSYLTLGRWHHLAFTYTPTDTTLYTDGAVRATKNYATTDFTTFHSTNGSIYTGYSAYNGIPQSQTGHVKNIRMWDRALSAPEIQQLYSDPWAGYALPQSRIWLPDEAAPATLRPPTWAGWRPKIA